FALLDARAARGEVHDVGGQPLGGELEGRARARARLVEEVEDRAPAPRGDLLDVAVGDLRERGGAVEQALDVVAREVGDGEEMLHAAISVCSEIVTLSSPSSSATRTKTRSERAVG